jgi:hypothetical protein
MRLYIVVSLFFVATPKVFAGSGCSRIDVSISEVDELKHLRQFQHGLVVNLNPSSDMDLSADQLALVLAVAKRRDIVFASKVDLPVHLGQLVAVQGCVD